MPPYEEEDFELVLGNRQLFFLAVVLFGLFFSIGYTVGYGRGRNSSDGVSAATQEPSSAAEVSAVSTPPVRPTEITPPISTPASDSGLSSPSVDTSASVEATSPDAPDGSPAIPPVTAPPVTSPGRPIESAKNPAPPSAAPLGVPSRTPASRPTAKAPAVTAPPSAEKQPVEPTLSSSSEVSAVAVAEIVPGNIYLQVLASREAEPARKALREIKSKGHPVALDNLDPDWYRILVGPFSTREAADAYMARLKGEGYNSFLRKF